MPAYGQCDVYVLTCVSAFSFYVGVLLFFFFMAAVCLKSCIFGLENARHSQTDGGAVELMAHIWQTQFA